MCILRARASMAAYSPSRYSSARAWNSRSVSSAGGGDCAAPEESERAVVCRLDAWATSAEQLLAAAQRQGGAAQRASLRPTGCAATWCERAE